MKASPTMRHVLSSSTGFEFFLNFFYTFLHTLSFKAKLQSYATIQEKKRRKLQWSKEYAQEYIFASTFIKHDDSLFNSFDAASKGTCRRCGDSVDADIRG